MWSCLLLASFWNVCEALVAIEPNGGTYSVGSTIEMSVDVGSLWDTDFGPYPIWMFTPSGGSALIICTMFGIDSGSITVENTPYKDKVTCSADLVTGGTYRVKIVYADAAEGIFSAHLAFNTVPFTDPAEFRVEYCDGNRFSPYASPVNGTSTLGFNDIVLFSCSTTLGYAIGTFTAKCGADAQWDPSIRSCEVDCQWQWLTDKDVEGTCNTVSNFQIQNGGLLVDDDHFNWILGSDLLASVDFNSASGTFTTAISNGTVSSANRVNDSFTELNLTITSLTLAQQGNLSVSRQGCTQSTRMSPVTTLTVKACDVSIFDPHASTAITGDVCNGMTASFTCNTAMGYAEKSFSAACQPDASWDPAVHQCVIETTTSNDAITESTKNTVVATTTPNEGNTDSARNTVCSQLWAGYIAAIVIALSFIVSAVIFAVTYLLRPEKKKLLGLLIALITVVLVLIILSIIFLCVSPKDDRTCGLTTLGIIGVVLGAVSVCVMIVCIILTALNCFHDKKIPKNSAVTDGGTNTGNEERNKKKNSDMPEMHSLTHASGNQ